MLYALIGLFWHMNKYHTYDFPDSKCLVVCGDIHGDFNLLVNKICVQYELKDTVVIVVGDCGFGFENIEGTIHQSLVLRTLTSKLAFFYRRNILQDARHHGTL